MPQTGPGLNPIRTTVELPRAATAASKPSSSSPGISLLRLRLGGREPVGDTTAQTIWTEVKGMLILEVPNILQVNNHGSVQEAFLTATVAL